MLSRARDYPSSLILYPSATLSYDPGKKRLTDDRPMPPSPSLPKPLHWLLRRTEQATVAILIGSGLFAVAGWWLYEGGARGRTVEIERAGPQTASFQVDIKMSRLIIPLV